MLFRSVRGDGDRRGRNRTPGKASIDGETPPAIGLTVVDPDRHSGGALLEGVLPLDPVGDYPARRADLIDRPRPSIEAKRVDGPHGPSLARTDTTSYPRGVIEIWSDSFARGLVVANAVATLFMTGLIWFVQIVHYPLLARVAASESTAIADDHQRRTAREIGRAHV